MALLLLTLVLGVIEMVGVASIFPLMAVLADPETIQKNQYLRYAYETLGFTDTNGFLIMLSTLAFGIVVVRSLFTAFTGYALVHYGQMRSHTLSMRLLRSYLRRPYAWFLNRHSADLGKVILSEVEQVIAGSLMPALRLVSRIIITVCIISVVIFVEPYVAATVVIGIMAAYGFIYLTVRGYLRRKGKERLQANRERFQIAQEVLGGVKEVKVGGLERGYLRRFRKSSYSFAKLRTQMFLVREVPRNLLELIAFGGILTVILALLFRANGDLNAVLPIIAVYAYAGLRLNPMVQMIFKCFVSLRFSGPALEALHKDLVEADHATDLDRVPALPLKREIALRNVTFVYPLAERPALRDMSLVIPARTSVGFVGATGAGKSTIIDILLGLLEPQNGQLLVDGQEITRKNARSWQRSIGYVPQQIFLVDESIAANIALGISPSKIDMAVVERAARLACLHDFIVDELPKGYDTEIGERGVRLSGGQRQRVGIARALYDNPDVLLFDEATSALDNLTEREIMEAVQNLPTETTIIMIAHRLTTVKQCDTIFHIKNGQVVASGKFTNLVRKDDDFRKMAGVI
jgi:ABC-type multidrug transport system fused ATPase/permease subunit